MKYITVVPVIMALSLLAAGCGKKTVQVTPPPASSIPVTLADVAKHTTSSDCWMVISGKVYNVTEYIPQHPGGDQIVLGCGKDATQLFNARPTKHNTPHPPDTADVLKQFYIGDVASQ